MRRVHRTKLSCHQKFTAFAPLLLCLILGPCIGCTSRTQRNEVAVDIHFASCFDVAVAGGTIHLLLGQPVGEQDTLAFYYARSTDGGNTWSPPMRVPTSHAPPGHHHRGNDPQIAVHGDRVMALWTARGDGVWGSGPIGVALSDDGGKTWRAGPVPRVMQRKTSRPTRRDARIIPVAHHGGDGGDGGAMDMHKWTGTGYRFPAVAAGQQAFHVIWIHARGEQRSIRAARLNYDADHWTDPVTLDPASCACCWNELAVAPEGALVALYRDREPRDMRAAVSGDGGQTWRQTPSVGAFDWQFNGCPHVGGGLAVTRGAWWASVWTGHPQRGGAYVLRSTDRGDSWTIVTQLQAHGGRGWHTDIAARSPTHAAAVWDQTDSDGGQRVFVVFTADAGETWSPPRQLSPPNRQAGYPRILTCNGRFVALWSEYSQVETPRLQIRMLDLNSM